ncbi:MULTISPECIES: hypothetical protein [Bradyrhizobium]|jgi:hypothetical protein|uniref:hypothetical protein n=1 Tax=Bradyrhizobium TaxID=374 RepID=UPI0004229090|nr:MULTISPECIES: hypothetical protein [Bradyrhizobium]MBO4224577.1 hypothetical protein [Bradyrhizobium neotropicale]
MDGVVPYLFELVAGLMGRALDWTGRRLGRMPDRDFSQVTTLQKIGRLTLCFAILVGLGGPLIWWVFG